MSDTTIIIISGLIIITIIFYIYRRYPRQTQYTGRFSNEKAHYESLISLLKYSITIVVGLLSIIGYMTYSSGKEMRDSVEAENIKLKSEIESMKADIKEDVKDSKERAVRQIDNIKNEATSIARDEARKKIDDVFDKRNLDEFVTDVAEKRIEPQIKAMVDTALSKVKNFNQQRIDSEISEIESDNFILQLNGLKYFELHTQVEFSEDQAARLIAVINKKEVNEVIKTKIAMVLKNKEGNTIKSFFESTMLKGLSNQLNYFAVEYCLMHELKSNIDLFKRAIGNSASKSPYYTDVVLTADRVNPMLLLTLLNDKEIIEYIIINSSQSEVANMKNNIDNNICNTQISKTQISNSYFYSKVK